MNYESLQTRLSDLPIGSMRYYEKIDSTNDEIARWVSSGAPDKSLVIANEQTAGRGRRGRKWFTYPNAALAFSIYLESPYQSDELITHHPHLSIISYLTVLGAIAICKALQKKYQLQPLIKWPNDVLLEKKKVAGVLTETQWNGEELSSAILGIGINISAKSIPSDEKIIFPATSVEAVFGKSISREDLLYSILENLIQLQTQLSQPDFLEIWNHFLAFRGDWVFFSSQDTNNTNEQMEAQVIGLDRYGGLKVLTKSGSTKVLYSGEISLRPNKK